MKLLAPRQLESLSFQQVDRLMELVLLLHRELQSKTHL
jgi:hypothetical protein